MSGREVKYKKGFRTRKPVPCMTCGGQFDVPSELVGHVKCPHCKTVIRVSRRAPATVKAV